MSAIRSIARHAGRGPPEILAAIDAGFLHVGEHHAALRSGTVDFSCPFVRVLARAKGTLSVDEVQPRRPPREAEDNPMMASAVERVSGQP